MSALGKLALLGIPVAGLAAGLGSAAASTAKGVLQGSRRTKQRKKDSESTYGGGEGPGEVGGWPGTRNKRRMFEQSQQLDEVGRLGVGKKVIDTIKTAGAKAGGAADKLAVTGLVGSAVYDALTAGEKIQANMRQGESPTQKAARKKRERQERIDRMKDSGRVYDADNIAGKQKVNEIKIPIRPAAAIGGAILAKKFLGPKKKEDGTEVGNAARAAVRGAIAAGGAIAGWKVGKAFNDSMKDSGSETKGKPKPRVRLQYNKDD